MPFSEIVWDSGTQIEGEDIVEFRLLYQGKLESGGGGGKIHAMRKEFHPQLKQLWANHVGIDSTVRRLGMATQPQGKSIEWQEAFKDGIDHLANEHQHHGFHFLPLVQKQFFLRCSLDILFLRREPPGHVFMKGDLDNRLSVLFNALRIPDMKQEVGNRKPNADEHPFYVLLQDDKLVTEVKVTTDQLLMLPHEIYDSNQVVLVINVKLQPHHPSTWQQVFL